MQLLLHVCRVKTSGQGLPVKAENIEPQTLNGDEFNRLIRYHRMLPVIFPIIKQTVEQSLPPLVSQTHAAGLILQYEAHKRFIQNINSEAGRLLHLLHQKGIPVVLLKGPLLARRYYGDSIHRHQGDIDLLAREKDIGNLHRLLTEQGYHTPFDYLFRRPVHKSLYFSFDNQVPYILKSSRVRVEIHSRLFNNRHLLPIPPEILFDRAQEDSFEGAAVKTLDTMDNILYLFAHGASHRWFRLKWLMDIHMLSHHPDWQWQTIAQRTKETGLEHIVNQGLTLCNRLFHTPLPQTTGEQDLSHSNKKNMSYLTDRALEEIEKSSFRLHKEGMAGVWRKMVYMMRLRKGFRFKIKTLDLLVYQEKNTSILRLPDLLSPLYFILNPFLALYRKLFKTQAANAKKAFAPR